MSETKFSPGPWRRGQIGNLRIYAADGQGEESGPIATILPKNGRQSANAALISAAPELYESLEEARELFELIGKFTGGELTRVTIWREKAEKALKAARGEAS